MCQCALVASVLGRPLDGPCGAVGSSGNALVMIRAIVWVGQQGSVSPHCTSAFQRASASGWHPQPCILSLGSLGGSQDGLSRAGDSQLSQLNHCLCIHSLQELLALAILTPLEGDCGSGVFPVSVSAARAEQLWSEACTNNQIPVRLFPPWVTCACQGLVSTVPMDEWLCPPQRASGGAVSPPPSGEALLCCPLS